jgi:hypothetical protein
MTRSARQTLLATFLCGVAGMVAIGVVGMRYVEHPRPLPPDELPYFTPPPLPPRYEAPPEAVVKTTPRRLARVHTSTPKPPTVAQKNCADDPLCGLILDR